MTQTQITEIVIATTNKGKLAEFQEIFDNVKFKSIDEVIDGGFDVEETETTFIGNATLKAKAGAKLSKQYTLADDSGIEIDALDGRPGIYSGRYLRSKEGGINGVLKELGELQEKQDQPLTKKCRFVCSLVLCDPQGEVIFHTEEYWNGNIASEARGEQGFGFDPIVLPDEYPDKTVAELGDAIKNKLSHRAQAVAKLVEFLT